MRSAKQGIVRDGNGTIVIGATISVYLAGTLTPATVYSTSASVVVINSVTSDSNGRYLFYIDSVDYAATQKFKIIGTHPSFTTFIIDDIIIQPVTLSQSVPDRTITASSSYNPLTDGVIYLDVSASDVTFNLCAIADLLPNNPFVYVQAINGDGTYSGYVAPNGAETIQGAAGAITLVNNEWVGLKKQSSTNWQYI